MTTKSRKRKSVSGPFEQAQRLFERGRFKQALKVAKACVRQQPSEQNRVFLERAYLARAQELCRFGLRDESRAVARKLTDLGVTDPSVERDLPRLLVGLGMYDPGAVGGEEHDLQAASPLLLAAADHAVLRPQETPTSLPEICQGALQVRAALEALEEGNEARVVEQLRGIARRSPFADWKYFVRGLAAYYRQDTAEMRANWDRLDPHRFATRIAAPLLALDQPGAVDSADRGVAQAVLRLEEAVVGGPISRCLCDLQSDVAADRWQGALRVLKRSAKTLRRLAPDLLERIISALYPMILRNDSRRCLSELTSVMPPPPLDPKWNRARAMFCEFSDGGGLEEAESYWLGYIDDLAELPALNPAERTLARALVWLRIGRMFAEVCKPGPRGFSPPGEYLRHLRERAAECFDASLELAPKLLQAYEALSELYLDGDQPACAAGTYRQLLDHFPDNADALLWLARHHLRYDEPLQAREYAQRLRELKPLDKTALDMLWTAHVGSVRHHALAKQWDQGRAEFEAAEALIPDHPKRHALLVRRVALEFKANDFALGYRFLDRAKSLFQESTGVLLALAIEAIRYALPRPVKAEFEHQWLAALKKRCRSETAGMMCETMTAYLVVDIDYPGRPRHVEKLLEYVRRCSRVKWQAGDLRNVCLFLEFLCQDDEICGGPHCEEYKLLEKYVRKGYKKFREEAFFQFSAGDMEMNRGPLKYNLRHAERCFQRALELAESSSAPEDRALAEIARQRLTFLGEVGSRPVPYMDSPFFDFFDDDDEAPCLDGPPPELARVFAAMCASMGVDPEDVLRDAAEGMPDAPRATRRNAGRPGKGKKKR